MKIYDPGIDVKKCGVQRSSYHKIAQTPKMFRLLSDGLYNFKIRAVVRELSTNAWDAHILGNKKNVQFDVHLPNMAEPYFCIRDYGPGLTPEQMDELYNTYGASDKTESDEYTGAMGLGSKSPFCFTKSFTVESYQNGKKHLFVNAVNEDGLPGGNYIGTTDAPNEPDGLKVTISVGQGHFYEFLREAQYIYKYFDEGRPKVSGNSGYVVQKETYSRQVCYTNGEGEGLQSWGIRKECENSGGQTHVIMGKVCYPVEADKLRGDNLDEKYLSLLNLGLDLYVDIGQVEMDISREGLQYNRRTFNGIKNALDKVMLVIKADIDAQFSSAKSYWDACCIYDKMIHGAYRKLEKFIFASKIQFNGKELKGYAILDGTKTILKKFYSNKRQDHVTHVDYQPNIAIYVNDVPRGAYAACKRAIDSGNYKTVYLLDKDQYDLQKDYFLDTLGISEAELVFVSTLPKPERGNVTAKSAEKIFLLDCRGQQTYKHANNGGTRQKKYWSPEQDIDIEDGGYYVEISNFNVSDPSGRWMESKEVVKLITLFTDVTGINVPDVVGVKSTAINKFNKHPSWINFFDYLKEKVEQFVQQDGKIAELFRANLAARINSDYYLDILKFGGKIQNTAGLFGSFASKLDDLKKQNKSAMYDQLLVLCNNVNVSITQPANVENLKDTEALVKAKYPLLDNNIISKYQFSGDNGKIAKICVDYIDMVDKLNP